ncbi:PRKCA-binding protein [Thelohanellus kitauei]|uniref:PRKCA-binding protein n=1 Tax=Thelohanellus kitauei TaxID=669202 RepID=A0A0C2MV58_THEKT|nr:PRKCA-binding protein [Thelohanellus kitauei]
MFETELAGGEYCGYMDKLDDRLRGSKQGTVELGKDDKNLIGITIGGGAPHCPVLYLVQVFENGPAHKSGVLEPGDEILSVNGRNCRGWAKSDLAKFIQSVKGHVRLTYLKFPCGLEDGKTTDIFMKKLKHKFVENVSMDTADALGLSRAVLSNDRTTHKVIELEKIGKVLKELKTYLVDQVAKLKNISKSYKGISDVFSEMMCHETSNNTIASFRLVSDSHQTFYNSTETLINEMDRILEKIHVFLTQIIPDTKLTLKKYLNLKFEYLSFCLKVKELEDEEADVLYDEEIGDRLHSGNYEYRLNLKCRHISKQKFLRAKEDFLEKMELLDQKNVEQVVLILNQYASAHFAYYDKCYEKSLILNDFDIELTESLCNKK